MCCVGGGGPCRIIEIYWTMVSINTLVEVGTHSPQASNLVPDEMHALEWC